MAESYGIPVEDGAARDFFINVAAIISADPAKYLLQGTDADALMLAAQDYADAYTLATNKPTRNELSIIQKDEQRNSCEALFRLYLMQIKFNMAISTEDKSAVGVRQPNPSRTRRDVPASLPSLMIVGALPGSQTLRFKEAEAAGNAKPFGAQTLELRVAIAETAVTDVELAKPCGLFSRNPIGVAFEPEDNKKIATYFARWANVRGQVGPWSSPVSMTIAA